jgi:hypothetical protein
LFKRVFETVAIINRGNPSTPILLVSRWRYIQVLSRLQIDPWNHEVNMGVGLISMSYPSDIERIGGFPRKHEVFEVLYDFLDLFIGWIIIRMKGYRAVCVGPSAMG